MKKYIWFCLAMGYVFSTPTGFPATASPANMSNHEMALQGLENTIPENEGNTENINPLMGNSTAQSPLVAMTGILEQGDPLLSDNTYYDVYTLTGEQGQLLTVTMAGDGFLPYVYVNSPDGQQFRDSANTVNNQVAVTVSLPVSGAYEIWANAYYEGEGGTYTITTTLDNAIVDLQSEDKRQTETSAPLPSAPPTSPIDPNENPSDETTPSPTPPSLTPPSPTSPSQETPSTGENEMPDPERPNPEISDPTDAEETASVMGESSATAAGFYEQYSGNISAIPLPACAENSTRLTRSEIQAIVLEHNRARKEADQYRPSNTPVLPSVTWDCAAAEVAQQYVNESRGTQGHSNREWRNQQYSARTGQQGNGANLGENLGWNVASSSTLIGPVVNAVTDWVDERSDYNHNSGACSGVCGHYTQIIWRESTGVGCGVERDSIPLNGNIWPHGYFLNCNYHYAGNVNGDNPLIEHPDWYYE